MERLAITLLLASMATGAAASDAPHIESLVPNQGPMVGGTVVTILGSGFAQGTAVRFNRNAGVNVQILSPSQLQVTMKSIDVMTDRNGNATASCRARNLPGSYAVLATPLGSGLTRSFSLTNTPAIGKRRAVR